MTVDWESPTPLVLRSPTSPREAAGLEAWATAQGLCGTCFFQTSGSEGLPKWVALHRRALLHSAQAVNAHLSADAHDTWLLALPLHHVGGFAILARAHLSGARLEQLQGKWAPHQFASTAITAQATLSSLVPTQIYDLVREKIPCPPSIRAVIIGGGSMTPALASGARELGWPVLQSYGMTEAASQVATQPLQPIPQPDSPSDLLLLPHWQASTEDDGRLRLRGPALASGYAQADASGRWHWQPLAAETGLLTRDHVQLRRHQGHTWLTFLGRQSGYIKILGELLHLAPQQARLEALAQAQNWPIMPVLHPIPDPRAGTALILVTEHGSPPTEPLLTAFHASSPPWLRISATRQLDTLPRSPLGKIRKTELTRLLTGECDSAVEQ